MSDTIKKAAESVAKTRNMVYKSGKDQCKRLKRG
jgi:hypothetical protein